MLFRSGRLPAVLAAELPTLLLAHWPCFYANGGPGFKTLKTVKRRLDACDPDQTRTIWMKTSEISHYWMARQLSDIMVEPPAVANQRIVRIDTMFPTPNFTLSLDCAAKQVQIEGKNLREVRTRRDFRSGRFLVEGKQTFVAFDLPLDATKLNITV